MAKVSYTISRFASFKLDKSDLSLITSLACRFLGLALLCLRCKPSFHKFFVVYDRLRRLRLFTPEATLEITIWPILLGSYVLTCHCRLEVNLSIAYINLR